MANEDNGTRFGDKSKIKKTVYRNGKLVKDEMERSPRPKANPRAVVKSTPAKPQPAKKAAPMEKSRVPNTRTKNENLKEVRRNARAIVDTTSPARSTKGKVGASTDNWIGKRDGDDRKAQQEKRAAKREKEPVAMKIYDKVYGKDKVKMK